MQIGAHVSISGSIDKAVDNALERECTAFQIFTRSPRSWHAKDLDDIEVKSFKEKLQASKIDRFATVAHMPYLPNLSSPDKDAHKKSVDTMIKEIERCRMLGIPYLVAHLGSHMGTGEDNAIKRLVDAFTRVVDSEKDVIVLLENTAGQKNSVGSDFEQLSSIFFQLKPAKRFGICLDTCHAFAAGYDLRGEEDVIKTLDKFDNAIGFEHLKILHLNDSKGDLGCNVDRHEHIGLGKIGEKGLSKVIKIMNKKKIPIVLETPIDDKRDDFANLKKARELA
ncbi:MAG: deoxyribonuclease IV [Nitrosopumilaceae archaeon]